jgi:hypothetical protein
VNLYRHVNINSDSHFAGRMPKYDIILARKEIFGNVNVKIVLYLYNVLTQYDKLSHFIMLIQ